MLIGFFFGIVAVIFLAFNAPVLGNAVRQWKLAKVGVFLAFVISGLQLDIKDVLEEIKNVKGPFTAVFSSFVVFPILTYFFANHFFPEGPKDFIVGSYILAVVPVTVASGTVFTGIARGNVPLSLYICLLSNSLGIFTIPFSLSLIMQLDQDINLPVFDMIQSLIILVLVPIVLGQLLRLKVKRNVDKSKRELSIFSQMIVLLFIFNAVSSSTSLIPQVALDLVFVAVFMIFLHITIPTTKLMNN